MTAKFTPHEPTTLSLKLGARMSSALAYTTILVELRTPVRSQPLDKVPDCADCPHFTHALTDHANQFCGLALLWSARNPNWLSPSIPSHLF